MNLQARNINISNPPVRRSQLTNAFSVGGWQARCTEKWLETQEAADGTTLAKPIWHWTGNLLYAGFDCLQKQDIVKLTYPRTDHEIYVQITDTSRFMWCQEVPDEPWPLTEICGSLKGHRDSLIHLAVHIHCKTPLKLESVFKGFDGLPELGMCIDGYPYWFPYFKGSLTPAADGTYLLQGTAEPSLLGT